MKGVWNDLIDRIKTNHPSATTKAEADRLEVSMGGVTIVAVVQGRSVNVDVTGQERASFDSKKYGEYHVVDELNKIWAANQKPRTSRGGSSYSGGGEDLDDAVGDQVAYEADDGDDD